MDTRSKALRRFLSKERQNGKTEVEAKLLAHLGTKGELRRTLESENFRQLGRFVLGRRKRVTRFIFHESFTGSEQQHAGLEAKTSLVEFKFPLREGHVLALELPLDLSAHEVERFSQFLNSITIGKGGN